MEAAGLPFSVSLVLWFRTGAPWTGFGTSLGFGPCVPSQWQPLQCVPRGQVGQGWGSIQDTPCPPALPSAGSWGGAGGVLLRTGEGGARFQTRLFLPQGWSRQVMLRLSGLEWGEGAGEEVDLQRGASPDLIGLCSPSFVGEH